MSDRLTDRTTLRELYKSAGLSQARAADKLGVSPDVFSHYVRGKTAIPPAIMAMAKELWGQPDKPGATRMPYAGSLPVAGLTKESSAAYETIEVPALASGEGRFVAQVGNTDEFETLSPQDLIIYDTSAGPRPGRLSVVADDEGTASLELWKGGPRDPKKGAHIGLVIAVLKEYGDDHGTILWDESGVFAE